MAIVKTDSKHYTNIATKIREKTGGDETYTPSKMADGVDAVFDAGKKAEHDAFWDAITDNGNRTNYQYAFWYQGVEYLRPNRKIIPTSLTGNLFMYCNKLKKVEAEYFDLSKASIGTSGTTSSMYYTFAYCYDLEEIEDIGLSPSYIYSYTFYSCKKLRKIAKITVDADTRFNNSFAYCTSLEEVLFEGEIGQNGLTLQYSTTLNKASIVSIINCLSTNTSGLTVTLSKTAVNNAFEGGSTGSEWLNLIAAKSNWTISLV